MNVDLTQDDIRRIVNHLTDEDDDFKLKAKLTRYVIPDLDEDKLAEKWQEWKKGDK